jgi:hypothetical protein
MAKNNSLSNNYINISDKIIMIMIVLKLNGDNCDVNNNKYNCNKIIII